jgi:hypothetical protein
MAGLAAFDGVAIESAPESSVTKKWRCWRCGLADGTRLVVTIGLKPPSKAHLAVRHEKLADAEQVERWEAFWKAALKQMYRWPSEGFYAPPDFSGAVCDAWLASAHISSL